MVILFISVIIFSGPIILVWNRRFLSFFEEKSDSFNALFFFGAVICKAKAFKMRRNGMTKDSVADFWGNIECALGKALLGTLLKI